MANESSERALEGHGESAAAVVTDPTVSRFHCSVPALSNGLRVQYLTSTGASFINGTRISTAVMKNGDELQAGSMKFVAECKVPVGFGTVIRRAECVFGKDAAAVVGNLIARSRALMGNEPSEKRQEETCLVM